MTRMQTFFTYVQRYDFFNTDILKVPCTEYHRTKCTTCNCEHNNFAMTECYAAW